MDELTIGDKTYISSKKAAQITGYAKDYVGQLCREGRVEARLVGRSWYVLEASIREHRFGESEKTREKQENTSEVLTTWESPSYKAETPEFIPPMKPEPAVAAPSIPSPVVDMQSVWKEWFEARERAAESSGHTSYAAPEPLEEEESEKPSEIQVRRIETVLEPYRAEEVDMEEEEYEEEREYPRKSISMPSILVVRALSIAVVVISVATAVVANGFFDFFERPEGISASVINFLDGTSTYKD